MDQKSEKLIEKVMCEIDLIFGGREKTWELLLVRFLELIMDEQKFTRTCWNKIRNPEDLYQFWVNYRRALRKEKGYTIIKGRDPAKDGCIQPILIKEILTPYSEKSKKNKKIKKKQNTG